MGVQLIACFELALQRAHISSVRALGSRRRPRNKRRQPPHCTSDTTAMCSSSMMSHSHNVQKQQPPTGPNKQSRMRGGWARGWRATTNT